MDNQKLTGLLITQDPSAQNCWRPLPRKQLRRQLYSNLQSIDCYSGLIIKVHFHSIGRPVCLGSDARDGHLTPKKRSEKLSSDLPRMPELLPLREKKGSDRPRMSELPNNQIIFHGLLSNIRSFPIFVYTRTGQQQRMAAVSGTARERHCKGI